MMAFFVRGFKKASEVSSGDKYVFGQSGTEVTHSEEVPGGCFSIREPDRPIFFVRPHKMVAKRTC